VSARPGTREQGAECVLLAPWLRRTELDGRLVLEYGDEIVVLGGRGGRALLDGMLPLLDGSRTAAEVAAELAIAPDVAEAVLAKLRAHGLVVAGPGAGEAATLCAACGAGVAPAEAESRLHAAAVAVVGESECAGELVRLLGRVVGEVRRRDWREPPEADAVVVAPAPSELPGLEPWNERRLADRVPWLQVLPFNGRLAALGPLFLPGETCCGACYEARRGAALGEPELFAALTRVPAAYPQWRGLAAALAGLAATLLLRWLGTADPTVPGTLFALELEDGLRIDAHRVLRVPRCAACSGTAGAAAPLPWGGA
jgi:bacteriocin biosynthesis cyclodehydratase domain-containing protein